MSIELNKKAYTELIEQDIKALRRDMPLSLERDHIELTLKAAIDFFYPKDDENDG